MKIFSKNVNICLFQQRNRTFKIRRKKVIKMKIFALAKCYGNLEFPGHIEINVIQEKNGWYRLPPTESIRTISGPFQLGAGYEFTGYYSLEIKGVSLIGDFIQVKRQPFITNGYLDTTESGINSPQITSHLSVRKNTEIMFWYVDVDDLPKISCLKKDPLKISFVPDDQEAFINRPFGFCHVYFCIGGRSFLPF